MFSTGYTLDDTGQVSAGACQLSNGQKEEGNEQQDHGKHKRSVGSRTRQFFYSVAPPFCSRTSGAICPAVQPLHIAASLLLRVVVPYDINSIVLRYIYIVAR